MNFSETLKYDSTYLPPCYCIRRSLEFDIQHDHIPKKLNFGLSSTPHVHPGDITKGVKLKSHLICFISIAFLPAKRLDRFGKIIEKFRLLAFEPDQGVGYGGNF